MWVYVVTLSDQYCDQTIDLMEVFKSREAADQWILKQKQDKEEGEYWTVHRMPVRD